MRTDSEIIAKAEAWQSADIFGTRQSDLVGCLPFESARQFLKDGVKPEQWKHEDRAPEAVKARLIDYLPFAWEKANHCRGLSAARSLDHMVAWLWLMGEDAFIRKTRLGDQYEYYGKPHLREISELVGFDWRKHDNGYWRNGEFEKGVPADQVARLIQPEPEA